MQQVGGDLLPVRHYTSEIRWIEKQFEHIRVRATADEEFRDPAGSTVRPQNIPIAVENERRV
jgi:hypothetical protein